MFYQYVEYIREILYLYFYTIVAFLQTNATEIKLIHVSKVGTILMGKIRLPAHPPYTKQYKKT